MKVRDFWFWQMRLGILKIGNLEIDILKHLYLGLHKINECENTKIQIVFNDTLL